uniref:Secreted protein n=1 Tax=Micrurus paraensis TaxID=1970185 RepID=A0A2D4JZR0_9SAUR
MKLTGLLWIPLALHTPEGTKSQQHCNAHTPPPKTPLHPQMATIKYNSQPLFMHSTCNAVVPISTHPFWGGCFTHSLKDPSYYFLGGGERERKKERAETMATFKHRNCWLGWLAKTAP